MLCSICNSVSKSPEDSRLSEHYSSFLEVVGDFTDTSFSVHFHSFYDLSVINYCCFLSRSGPCWLLVSLVVSKLLISPCPLFLLGVQLTSSFLLISKSRTFLPKSAPSSSSWFVCVIIECKIQNTEVMDLNDMTHSLLLIPDKLIQQYTADHLERPVRQLFQYLCCTYAVQYIFVNV